MGVADTFFALSESPELQNIYMESLYIIIAKHLLALAVFFPEAMTFLLYIIKGDTM